MKLFCAKMFCFCCLVFTYFGFVSWFFLALCFLCRKNFFLKNKQTQIILIVSFTILLMHTLIWTFPYLCEFSWSYVWVFSFLREAFFYLCSFVRISSYLWSSVKLYFYLCACILTHMQLFSSPIFLWEPFWTSFCSFKTLWK